MWLNCFWVYVKDETVSVVSEREVKTPRSGYPVTNYLRYETLRNRAISSAIVDCDDLLFSQENSGLQQL